MPRTASQHPWLGLGEASKLLGVSPQTLRRWSDAGQVRVYTTPGGHRRFHRQALQRLIPHPGLERRSLIAGGLTPARLARAYRREARDAGREVAWIGLLKPEQREWFRVHGRRLAEQLLAHLDDGDDERRRDHLVEATTEAADYGRMAAELGLSLGQAVEGFLQFRRPFLHELALLSQRREFDAEQASSLMESAEHALDRLLVATITAQSVGLVAVEVGR